MIDAEDSVSFILSTSLSIGDGTPFHSLHGCWEKRNGAPESADRQELRRYMHCYDQYQAYHWSLEREGELERQFAQIKSCTGEKEISCTEREAFRVLRESRRILKYTYALAYYLKQTNQAEIFKRNQVDLEAATKALSACFTKEINEEEQLAGELMDKKSYCDDRRKALLDHCREGYEANYWTGLNES